MMAILKATLISNKLKVILGFNCAKTAALKDMHTIVTKKSSRIRATFGAVLFKINMAAMEPKQL